jgi:hypothetical protein
VPSTCSLCAKARALWHQHRRRYSASTTSSSSLSSLQRSTRPLKCACPFCSCVFHMKLIAAPREYLCTLLNSARLGRSDQVITGSHVSELVAGKVRARASQDCERDGRVRRVKMIARQKLLPAPRTSLERSLSRSRRIPWRCCHILD